MCGYMDIHTHIYVYIDVYVRYPWVNWVYDIYSTCTYMYGYIDIHIHTQFCRATCIFVRVYRYTDRYIVLQIYKFYRFICQRVYVYVYVYRVLWYATEGGDMDSHNYVSEALRSQSPISCIRGTDGLPPHLGGRQYLIQRFSGSGYALVLLYAS